MPIVEIRMLHGRPNEKIEECIREVARAVSRSLDAPLETVRVFVHELPRNRWAAGDVLKSDPPADG